MGLLSPYHRVKGQIYYIKVNKKKEKGKVMKRISA